MSEARLEYRIPLPSENEVAEKSPRKGPRVRVASDADVAKAMKRISRDHDALIKALAK